MFLSVKKSSLARFLEQAILSDERRNSFIYKALHTYIQNEALVSTAFIWENKAQENYHIVAAGLQEIDIFNWLSEEPVSITQSILLQNDNSSPLRNYEMSVFPTKHDGEITGFWIVWGHKFIPKNDEQVTFILPYLEVITVIDQPKEIRVDGNVLHDDLIEAFQHKDPSAIIAMLSLFRVIGDANLVYWGDIVNQSITITSHLGAKHDRFGFELPVGEGFGGKAAHMKNMLTVNDYQNSPYRVHRVSETIDREGLRSGIVLPIKDKHVQASGLLYVARREVRPFSLLQQMSLLRLVQSVEPLHYEPTKLKSFFMSHGVAHSLAHHKNELRKLIEREKELASIEKWAMNILRGTFIVLDRHGMPYNITRKNEICEENLSEIPLTSANGLALGSIFYHTTIPLHKTDWPDLLEDITSACRIILERQMLLQRGSTYKYTSWLSELLNLSIDETGVNELFYTGLQLGLPIEKGEVWVIAWEDNHKILDHLQLRLNQATFALTKRRLIFFNEYAILIFSHDDEKITPDLLRNELLKMFSAKVWLVHGASFDTFTELNTAIEQSISILNDAKQADTAQFVIEQKQSGLEMLFEKADIRNKLDDFASELLQPVMTYDEKNKTNFTETLVYDCLLQSPDDVAKQLFIHKNTVLYRVKRAKEILQLENDSPKNRIALELAAYQWIKQTNPQLLATLNVTEAK